jgi:hypothetical protein
MIVHDSDNLEDIGNDLWKMFVSFAIVNTVVFFLVAWCKYPQKLKIRQKKKKYI